MKITIIPAILALSLILPRPVWSEGGGFRWCTNACFSECTPAARSGKNMYVFGECGYIAGKYIVDQDRSKQSVAGLELLDSVVSRINFKEADLSSFRAIRTDFTKVNFTRASMDHGMLVSSNCYGCSFAAVQAPKFFCRDSSLFETPFREANLPRATFESCRVQGLNFSGATLDSGRIHHSWFTRVDFRDSHLADLKVTSTDFREADFRGADLQGWTFEDFNFPPSDFRGARFNSKTKLPFSKAEALSRGMIEVQE
mgnify:CR=1 FL=1